MKASDSSFPAEVQASPLAWTPGPPTVPGLYLVDDEAALGNVDLFRMNADGRLFMRNRGEWDQMEEIDLDPSWIYLGPIKGEAAQGDSEKAHTEG